MDRKKTIRLLVLVFSDPSFGNFLPESRNLSVQVSYNNGPVTIAPCRILSILSEAVASLRTPLTPSVVALRG